MVLLVSLLLIAGCGIPQEDYDAVLAERDTAQTQVASLQGDLVEAESQIETLESSLTETQSELESTRSELEAAQSQVQSLKNQLSSAQSQVQAQSQKMEKARTFAEVISSLFVPVLSGEAINEFEVFMQWTNSIQAVDDREVDRLFDAVIASGGGAHELIDFYLYIFET